MLIGAEHVSREVAEQCEGHIYAQCIFSSSLRFQDNRRSNFTKQAGENNKLHFPEIIGYVFISQSVEFCTGFPHIH
jgi:hypothetical protein